MDILDELSRQAVDRLERGYYRGRKNEERNSNGSFAEAIAAAPATPVVAEIKPRSPTEGKLFSGPIETLATTYVEGGATGFSVLTDPDNFGGGLCSMGAVASLGLPVLMKDFVVSPTQIRSGVAWGASAILLIHRLFSRGFTEMTLEEAINIAHQLNLEVLLEVNDGEEYRIALESEADMIGINNRDLRTMKVDLNTTVSILSEFEKDRIVWSLSGIKSGEDIAFLRKAGAEVFLVGTALLKSDEPAGLLSSMVGVEDG